MNNNSLVLEKIKEFISIDDNIRFAILFGSFLTKEFNTKSDIDIAFYFNQYPKEIEFLYFLNKISEFIKKDIDVVILNMASSFLRHQVMKYGKPIIIKDRELYVKFREKTISDYDEYKYISGMDIYDR